MTISMTSVGANAASMNAKFEMFNPSNVSINTDNWQAGGTTPVTKIMATNAPWVPPFRGTRGPNGLPLYGKLSIPFGSGPYVDFEITIVKRRRPTHNLAGDSFDNAPATQTGVTYFGSISQRDPGQFMKITLAPNETFYVKGHVSVHGTYNPLCEVNLFTASRVWVRRLVQESPSFITEQDFQSLPFTTQTLCQPITTSRFMLRLIPIQTRPITSRRIRGFWALTPMFFR